MNSEALLRWYALHGRTHLPWRTTRDPYRIVVSEFMLQQTQVERVIPIYNAFIAAWPGFRELAAATSGDVVRAWRGLGYNSRAMRLHALARAVVADYGGELPHDRETLLKLPGIGPYTAAAVRAFAFELDDVAFDTNLRRIVHRTAFGLEYPPRAAGRELDAYAREELPPGRAHAWNSALMDVGATICTARAPKCLLCPLRESCAAAPVDAAQLAALAQHHARRSPQESLPFERTTRFLRGRIVDRLRDVPAGGTIAFSALIASLSEIVPADRLNDVPAAVDALERDGILEHREGAIKLC